MRIVYSPQIYAKPAEAKAIGESLLSHGRAIMPSLIIPASTAALDVHSISAVEKRVSRFVNILKGRIDRSSMLWDPVTFYCDVGLIPEHEPDRPSFQSIEIYYSRLHEEGFNAIPVARLGHSVKRLQVLKNYGQTVGKTFCIRLTFDSLRMFDTETEIRNIMQIFGVVPGEVDLIIDFGFMSGIPVNAESWIGRIGHLAHWRRIIIAGGSISNRAGAYTVGMNYQVRHEWQMWMSLKQGLLRDRENVVFGDYATRNPIPLLHSFVRRGTAKILYTVQGTTIVLKDGRKEIGLAGDAYREMCKTLSECDFFVGHNFSVGDRNIVLCSTVANPPSYRRYYIECELNHHFSQVINEIEVLRPAMAAA